MAPSPKTIAITIANIVFALGVILSGVIVAFSIHQINSPDTASEALWFYKITLFSGAIFVILFGLCLRAVDRYKINLSLLTLSIIIPVFGFEIYLEIAPYSSPDTATIEGSSHDNRTKIQVISDLRSKGIDAYPNVSGSQFIKTNGLTSLPHKQKLYMLGGVSEKTIVYCNESGKWTVFESDEHGFNNPTALYVKNNIDIALIGDSFTEGACVNPDQTIAAVLRESGLNVISLGKGGNGSLLNFATFREYATPLKPKIVLWMHYVNDIDDLTNKGMESSFLSSYLTDNDFSQDLILRQKEIDDVLKVYINQKYREHKISDEQKDTTKRQGNNLENGRNQENRSEKDQTADDSRRISSLSRVFEIFKLTRLRERVGFRPPRPTPKSPVEQTFREILRKSNEAVAQWNGRLYLVFLHAFERYQSGREHDVYFREFVLRTATELNIPVIDIHEEVFLSHPDPLSLFPNRGARHYNSAGYRLVADTIYARLRFNREFP